MLLRDFLGSTDQVFGAMTLQPVGNAGPTGFDAWGQRRDGETWSQSQPWTQALETLLRQTTTQGYTGHEMAESVGVIHMNGRIYDPALARFLQADPYVQSPHDSQSWNRYSYTFNNPLAYTDPSGNIALMDVVRVAAAVVIAVYSGGTAAGASWGMFGSAVTAYSAQSFAIIAVGGFAAGAVQTGTLRGALAASVSATVFYGVGSAFTSQSAPWAYSGETIKFSGYAAKTLTHGIAGGVMSTLQGGNFGHGFASAGFGEAMSPTLAGIESVPGQAIATAVVGGTASVLAGGKFGNGAVTAAFGFAFNRLGHPGNESPSKSITNKQRKALISASSNFRKYVTALSSDQAHIDFPDLVSWDTTFGDPETATEMWQKRVSDIMIEWQSSEIPKYIVQGWVDEFDSFAYGKLVGFGLSSVGKVAKEGWSIFNSVNTWYGRGDGFFGFGKQPEVTIACSVAQDACRYFLGD